MTHPIASNHGDVLHWFPKHGKSMDDFRAAVAAEMKKEDDDMVTYKKFEEIPTYYQGAVKKVMEKGAMSISDGVSEDVCRMLTIMDRLGKLD